MLGVRHWAAKFGAPYKCISDGGPGFREAFVTEFDKMGIDAIKSSCYNLTRNDLAERAVRSIKDVLEKTNQIVKKKKKN